ncbi:HAMP domain-containing histidine kinase [Candidatus Acetothermia bacterium]|nr:HAMP domain-containing histidine kinase [Candidatus Acetothermia bacterium]MBI3459638.1 HAMP domain-containing histidine kinase [Candidatus Acetothermia bacterium]MBI3659829.1 HAMP domain-containing histidine kinase [Candidatus Acetothermia bacterium]
MRFWPLSIRWKFIITIIAFTLVLAVPFGFLTLKLITDNTADTFQAGWETAVKIWGLVLLTPGGVSRMSGPDGQTECQNLIENLTKEFAPPGKLAQGETALLYVQVVLFGKESCSHTAFAADGKSPLLPLPPVDEPLPADVQQNEEGKLEVQNTQASEVGKYLDIRYAQPYKVGIVQPTIAYAYLRVGVSLTSAQERLQRDATVITLIVLGYVLVGILIAFAFSKMILGPVEVLAKAVSRFKQDRSARAKVKSGDELEWLAQEFNTMADAIEERRRELERINAALVKANRVKSEFLAVMGHELKTPLHAIRGYSQLLLEGVDGPLTQAQQDDLANILQSGDHLLELIDNILRFSKLEAGEEKLYLESVRASDLVEDAIKNISSLARNKGLQLRVYSEPIPLMCDRTKVRQILINLLSNAVKHTRQGKIEIAAEQKDNTVRFAVTDTGIGIAPEYHEKIFEPFTQIDSSTTRESHGVGLGLAIVKKYVEMHGGRVGVESQPGQGSTFFFSIPLTPQLSTNGLPAKEETNANPDRRGRSELTQPAP